MYESMRAVILGYALLLLTGVGMYVASIGKLNFYDTVILIGVQAYMVTHLIIIVVECRLGGQHDIR